MLRGIMPDILYPKIIYKPQKPKRQPNYKIPDALFWSIIEDYKNGMSIKQAVYRHNIPTYSIYWQIKRRKLKVKRHQNVNPPDLYILYKNRDCSRTEFLARHGITEKRLHSIEEGVNCARRKNRKANAERTSTSI
jgi:hypothetical protein